MAAPRPDSDYSVEERAVLNEANAGIVKRATWKGRIWDTFDLPKEERKLLFKVDAVLLTLMSLGYFLKNLDQKNIDNAFFSGMKEELQMNGNELVTAVSIWTVGYVVGQIPVNLILTRVSPRWVIPALEIGWGVATLASYSVKSYQQLYACRFLVGLFESGFYSAAHMILGSWYTPRELGKRAMIFWLSGSIGQMFSGFLQAAAYTNLHEVHGLAGWRWLFIIDGIITLPIAIAGFFFFPPIPGQGSGTWWLTPAEFRLAGARVTNAGKSGRTPWTRAKFKRLFSTWHIYFLPLLYVIWNNGNPQNPIAYWLKSFNAKPAPVPGRSWTVPQINNLPLPGTAILIVFGATGAWVSDGVLNGRRYPIIYFGAIWTLIFTITMKTLPLYQNINAHFAIYWLVNGGVLAGPLILTWINEITAFDFEKRALLVAMGNDLAYVVQAVAPNFIWKTTSFPNPQKGFTWSIVLNVLLILWTTAVFFLSRRDKQLAAQRLERGTTTPDSGDLSVEDVDVKENPFEEQAKDSEHAKQLRSVV